MARGVQSAVLLALVSKPEMDASRPTPSFQRPCPIAAWKHEAAIFAPTSPVMLKSAAVSIPPSAKPASARPLHQAPSLGVILGAAGPLESRPSPSECCRTIALVGKGVGVENRPPGPRAIINPQLCGLGPAGPPASRSDVPCSSWNLLSRGLECGGIGSATMATGRGLPALIALGSPAREITRTTTGDDP